MPKNYDLQEWKPTATDQTCALLKCEGCAEQKRPTPCDRWYYKVVYFFVRLINWR